MYLRSKKILGISCFRYMYIDDYCYTPLFYTFNIQFCESVVTILVWLATLPTREPLLLHSEMEAS